MATVTKAVSTEFLVSGTRWTSPSNAFATTGDNVYATAAPAKNGQILSGFGCAFTTSDIPNGATVNSLTATVEWKLSATVTGGQLFIVHALGPGATEVGATGVTKTTLVEEQSTSAFTPAQSAGFPSLANLRTAASDSNGAWFLDVYCSKGNTNSALTGSIDFISVTADYTEPALAPPFDLPGRRRRRSAIRTG